MKVRQLTTGDDSVYVRKCPECKRDVKHSGDWAKTSAIRSDAAGVHCRSCAATKAHAKGVHDWTQCKGFKIKTTDLKAFGEAFEQCVFPSVVEKSEANTIRNLNKRKAELQLQLVEMALAELEEK